MPIPNTSIRHYGIVMNSHDLKHDDENSCHSGHGADWSLYRLRRAAAEVPGNGDGLTTVTNDASVKNLAGPAYASSSGFDHVWPDPDLSNNTASEGTLAIAPGPDASTSSQALTPTPSIWARRGSFPLPSLATLTLDVADVDLDSR